MNEYFLYFIKHYNAYDDDEYIKYIAIQLHKEYNERKIY